MKRIFSLLLIVALLCCMVPTAVAADDAATAAADRLNGLGLFNGTGTDVNGKPIYELERTLTRDEAVTMLVRILGKETEAKNGNWNLPFTDVAAWAKPYVGYAYANGLTSGTSATTFGGSSAVTATQYLTFVLRALGYESGTDFRWDAAWVLSDALGITSGEYSERTNVFLRGNVVQISCAALNACLKGQDATLIRSLVSAGAVEETAALEQGFDLYGVTSKVHFIYDIRTFTLYAFLNYTGYDDNNGRPIKDTRAALRQDLAAMDIDISVPNYYTNKAQMQNVREYDYAAALLALGPAPEFAYIDDKNVHPKLSDLPAKLSEFYEAADIPALYEKYRADHENLLKRYEQALPDIVKMVSYFDAQELVEGEFGMEVVLLDAWERGTGLGSADQYYGYGVIRTGPSNNINNLNVLHEYAHGFVNRALDQNKSQMSALSSYFKRNCDAVKQGYDNWTGICYESFVRAISAYFDSSRSEQVKARVIADEVRLGFVMTQYVYDRLPEFEGFDGDFEAFIKLLLEEYPDYA